MSADAPRSLPCAAPSATWGRVAGSALLAAVGGAGVAPLRHIRAWRCVGPRTIAVSTEACPAPECPQPCPVGNPEMRA